MTAVLDRPVFRCRACQGSQFTIIFGGKHQPVATCQNCGQSWELWPRSAGAVRLVNDDGSFAELPIQVQAAPP